MRVLARAATMTDLIHQNHNPLPRLLFAIIFQLITISVQNNFWYFFGFYQFFLLFGGSVDLVEAIDS
jgi:hypothetical protein